MQAVTRDALIKRASELLSDGTVSRVLGYKAGEFSYDVTPAVFESAEELEAGFVYDSFCGANFSKYLISPKRLSLKVSLSIFLFVLRTVRYSQVSTMYHIAHWGM